MCQCCHLHLLLECCVFEPGDQALVSGLFPSPFEAKFEGPYVVKRKLSDENYVIATPHQRKSTKFSTEVNSLHSALFAVSDAKDSLCSGERKKKGKESDDSILHGQVNNSESLEKLNIILTHLPPSQFAEMSELLQSFSELFGDMPF